MGLWRGTIPPVFFDLTRGGAELRGAGAVPCPCVYRDDIEPLLLLRCAIFKPYAAAQVKPESTDVRKLPAGRGRADIARSFRIHPVDSTRGVDPTCTHKRLRSPKGCHTAAGGPKRLPKTANMVPAMVL